MALDIVRGELDPTAATQGMRINWGAIFCGTFAIFGFGLSFVLLGNALGLSASNLISATTSPGLTAASWLFNCVCLLVSFYIGGYVSCLMGGLDSRLYGILYGITSWAVAGSIIVAYGITQSVIFKEIIGGLGPNAANWLMACVAVFGALTAALGGFAAGTNLRGMTFEARDRVDTKSRAA